MLAVIVLLVPLLLFAALASDVRQGALAPGVDPHATFDFYVDRGVFIVFWGLAALLVTVALGTIFGRTMPAVMVALIVCLFVRGSWESLWTHTALRALAVQGGDQGTWGTPDLWVYQTDELYLNGQVWTGDINAWFEAHQYFGPTPDASGVVPTGGPQPVDPGPPPMPKSYVIHGDQFEVQGVGWGSEDEIDRPLGKAAQCLPGVAEVCGAEVGRVERRGVRKQRLRMLARVERKRLLLLCPCLHFLHSFAPDSRLRLTCNEGTRLHPELSHHPVARRITSFGHTE